MLRRGVTSAYSLTELHGSVMVAPCAIRSARSSASLDRPKDPQGDPRPNLWPIFLFLFFYVNVIFLDHKSHVHPPPLCPYPVLPRLQARV